MQAIKSNYRKQYGYISDGELRRMGAKVAPRATEFVIEELQLKDKERFDK